MSHLTQQYCTVARWLVSSGRMLAEHVPCETVLDHAARLMRRRNVYRVAIKPPGPMHGWVWDRYAGTLLETNG
jgi:hypothetical protein